MHLLYLYLGIYIILLIGLSFFLSKKQSKESFLISGRNRNSIQILLSKFAGAVGVSWFITYTAYSYKFGNGMLFVITGLVIGYIIFAYWAAPKIYEHSREKKFYTIGDFVYYKTESKMAKILVNSVSIFAQILWLLISIIGGAKIMADFGLLSYEAAVFITSLIMLIYILMAGYQAIILTDVFQSIIIICLLIVVSFTIAYNESFMTILNSGSGRMNIGGSIGLFLWGILSVFAQSERYQLCYAAKDKSTLKKGIGLAVIPILVTVLLF